VAGEVGLMQFAAGLLLMILGIYLVGNATWNLPIPGVSVPQVSDPDWDFMLLLGTGVMALGLMLLVWVDDDRI